MKEQFRAILAGDLSRDEAGELLDRWCSRAQRSRLAPFVKVAKTMRERRELILNSVEHGISNGRVEGFTKKVFHLTTQAAAPPRWAQRLHRCRALPEPGELRCRARCTRGE